MGSSALPSPSSSEKAPVACREPGAAAAGPGFSESIVPCLPAMGDASFSDSLLDPSKWGVLSLDEKKDMVYKLSRCSQESPEVLHSWSRKDLLEILCAEMGKERKYTGLTKHKLIEHLLRVVVEKKPDNMTEVVDAASSAPPVQSPPKRQRRNDGSSGVAVPASTSAPPPTVKIDGEAAADSICCKNSACRAVISQNDGFCKRCSCCICRKFDDNKDPSIWLVCNSDPPFPGSSCGMSCHLDCALKHDRSGISNSKRGEKLDGSFYCVVCGKMNDLLGCWKKQLIVAKDARRLDVLCQRIHLSYKLLCGSEKYKKLHANVEVAKKKLEAEVGSLNELPTGMARYIVNRLSCGAEVQKLCVSALDLLESADSSPKLFFQFINKSFSKPSVAIKSEDVSPTSLKVVVSSHNDLQLSEPATHYSLWLRKAGAYDYPEEPISKLDEPNREFLVSDLIPGTEYLFKVVAFCNEKEVGKWEVKARMTGGVLDVPNRTITKSHSELSKENSSEQSDPSSVADECNNAAVCADLNELPTKDIPCCDKDDNPSKDASNYMDNDHSSDALISYDVGRTGSLGQQGDAPVESGYALDEEPKLGTNAKPACFKDSTNMTERNLISDSEKFENQRTPSGSGSEMMLVPLKNTDSALPVTPSRLESNLEPPKRTSRAKRGRQESMPQMPVKEPTTENSSKAISLQMIEKAGTVCNNDGSLESDYEYCVKVVRWLERKGHIEADFRVKFLTWFSLRATAQERRVVSVFVDTLIEDPPSLADQLVDTFSDSICNKAPPPATKGFCMRLWH